MYVRNTKREQADAYFINQIKVRATNKIHLMTG